MDAQYISYKSNGRLERYILVFSGTVFVVAAGLAITGFLKSHLFLTGISIVLALAALRILFRFSTRINSLPIVVAVAETGIWFGRISKDWIPWSEVERIEVDLSSDSWNLMTVHIPDEDRFLQDFPICLCERLAGAAGVLRPRAAITLRILDARPADIVSEIRSVTEPYEIPIVESTDGLSESFSGLPRRFSRQSALTFLTKLLPGKSPSIPT